MATLRPRRSETRGSPKRLRRFDQRPSRIQGSQAREHFGAAKRSPLAATAISRTRGRGKVRRRQPDVAVGLHLPPRRAPGLGHASAVETPPESAAPSLLSRRLPCSRISRLLVLVPWGSRHCFLATKVYLFRQNASSMVLILVQAEKLEAVYPERPGSEAALAEWISNPSSTAAAPARSSHELASMLRVPTRSRRARRGQGENVCPFADGALGCTGCHGDRIPEASGSGRARRSPAGSPAALPNVCRSAAARPRRRGREQPEAESNPIIRPIPVLREVCDRLRL